MVTSGTVFAAEHITGCCTAVAYGNCTNYNNCRGTNGNATKSPRVAFHAFAVVLQLAGTPKHHFC